MPELTHHLTPEAIAQGKSMLMAARALVIELDNGDTKRTLGLFIGLADGLFDAYESLLQERTIAIQYAGAEGFISATGYQPRLVEDCMAVMVAHVRLLQRELQATKERADKAEALAEILADPGHYERFQSGIEHSLVVVERTDEGNADKLPVSAFDVQDYEELIAALRSEISNLKAEALRWEKPAARWRKMRKEIENLPCECLLRESALLSGVSMEGKCQRCEALARIDQVAGADIPDTDEVALLKAELSERMKDIEHLQSTLHVAAVDNEKLKAELVSLKQIERAAVESLNDWAAKLQQIREGIPKQKLPGGHSDEDAYESGWDDASDAVLDLINSITGKPSQGVVQPDASECIRVAGHDGPCNGFPRKDCPQ